ncbi:MAG: hypothetical protein Q7U98_17260 [Methylicorpusculum sp.]|uniref:hypothetical protein n=1 Tax=Methylicorpusculum sp. TaxID=2713644 RepID=UPI002724CA1F|nr:hypothetical protein [Methylicorpusculum sp.]MDO8940906.1 hypothetical protein [Methylicorpusculum sp.]MDP2202403.1 hypothetical protein [Methylicorpusculum sp.]
MRNIKNIRLDDARQVTIQELRVKDVRRLMREAKALEDLDVKVLLTERFDELTPLLGDCLQLPAGETLDELSFSEITLIKSGFVEVNQDFLELMGLVNALKTPSTTSTEPVLP